MINLKSQKIEWIGEIPINWELRKIKYIFKERKEMNNPIKSKNLISLTIDKGVIPHSEKKGGGNKPKEDISKYKLVYPGDIVLNSMNVIAGAVGLSKYFGVVSPVYYMLHPIDSDSDNEYFKHLFRTEVFQKSLYGLGNGILIKENEDTGKLNTIRMRISMDKLGNQFIPFPPNQEQKLISQYLNKKTSQIDSIIEKIEKKIELLNEQKTALINQYVTKGIDPNVEMKDSGVDWIGEIPKDWDIQKIKYFSTIELSTIDRHQYKEEKRVFICHYPDVYKNEYLNKDTKLPSGTCSEYEFQKFSLLKDDILLTKDSESPDEIGIPTFVLEKLENTVCGYHLAVIRIRNNLVYPEFLYRFLESKCSKDYFFISSNGITRYGLSKSSIENLFVSFPNRNMQLKIIKRIKDLSKFTEDSNLLLSSKINLLKEYRLSLISSVVTGKIRITEVMI